MNSGETEIICFPLHSAVLNIWLSYKNKQLFSQQGSQTTQRHSSITTDEGVHRRGCTQTRMYTDEGVHRRGYIQTTVYKDEGVHRQGCTQTRVYTNEGIQRRGCTQMRVYTDKGVHRQEYVQTRVYTDEDIHTRRYKSQRQSLCLCMLVVFTLRIISVERKNIIHLS